jgi:hypothetical protein
MNPRNGCGWSTRSIRRRTPRGMDAVEIEEASPGGYRECHRWMFEERFETGGLEEEGDEGYESDIDWAEICGRRKASRWWIEYVRESIREHHAREWAWMEERLMELRRAEETSREEEEFEAVDEGRWCSYTGEEECHGACCDGGGDEYPF